MNLFLFVLSAGCTRHQSAYPDTNTVTAPGQLTSAPIDTAGRMINEALLLTRFTTMESLQDVVQIQYGGKLPEDSTARPAKPWVKLTHQSAGRQVISILESGISQSDFARAKNGNVLDKIEVALRCPYAVNHRIELRAIENLGRRRPWQFGKGDVAFYDLAETMVEHIFAEDTLQMTAKDLSEKGYLNTFNHITAQAFMTSIFGEEMADFVADVHERFNMPELITGHFTAAQLANPETGPVDNYLDIINNEWGQELGKMLGKKYKIRRKSLWTPELLTSYLNDIQSYHSWAFRIAFTPFRPSDEKVIQFANKLNFVLTSP